MTMASKTAVLVCGMHRSGTSALSRVLNLLGCALPKTLLGGGPGNETGHWESIKVTELNDNILASAGQTWRDWRPLQPGFPTAARDFAGRAAELLHEEYADATFIVLKDPRLCRLLGFWLEVLAGEAYRPLIVAPIRHPREVAASLNARDGIAPSITSLLWLRYMIDLESASRSEHRVFLDFGSVLSDSEAAIERLGQALAISWPKSFESSKGEIDAFLDPSRRNHVEDDRALLDDGNVSTWLRSSYGIFQRWTRDREQSNDRAKLDSIRTQFDQASILFSPAILDEQEAVRALRRKVRAAVAALQSDVES